MKHIVVVEDSPMVMKVIKHVLSGATFFNPFYAMSFKDAKQIIDEKGEELFAALVDLNLPDAPNGEVVDYALSAKIPTIVLTGSFDEQRREALLEKGIVDYVIKEGRYSYSYAVGLLNRLVKNQQKKVLVVDDSATARRVVKNLLQLHLFEVIEASDGMQAIKAVVENPDICMMITDFNMPRMDGCELVKHIRSKYEKADLAIIGISSEGEGTLSARFIKNGANDFLKKPFNHEEFFCRVSHNLELLELIASIRDASYRDELTGIYNRKYFFSEAASYFSGSVNGQTIVTAAIIDLDGFTQINELFGSDIGDTILGGVAKLLDNAFQKFMLARASGDTFYVLMPGLSNAKAVEFIGQVRQIVCSQVFDCNGEHTSVSFSAGVSSVQSESVDTLLHHCLVSLKRAKEAGGDLVFGDD